MQLTQRRAQFAQSLKPRSDLDFGLLTLLVDLSFQLADVSPVGVAPPLEFLRVGLDMRHDDALVTVLLSRVSKHQKCRDWGKGSRDSGKSVAAQIRKFFPSVAILSLSPKITNSHRLSGDST